MPRVRSAPLEQDRLEQPREVPPHHLRGRHRCEVGSALSMGASAESLAESEQDQHARQHRGEHSEHEQSGLP